MRNYCLSRHKKPLYRRMAFITQPARVPGLVAGGRAA